MSEHFRWPSPRLASRWLRSPGPSRRHEGRPRLPAAEPELRARPGGRVAPSGGALHEEVSAPPRARAADGGGGTLTGAGDGDPPGRRAGGGPRGEARRPELRSCPRGRSDPPEEGRSGLACGPSSGFRSNKQTPLGSRCRRLGDQTLVSRPRSCHTAVSPRPSEGGPGGPRSAVLSRVGSAAGHTRGHAPLGLCRPSLRGGLCAPRGSAVWVCVETVNFRAVPWLLRTSLFLKERSPLPARGCGLRRKAQPPAAALPAALRTDAQRVCP